MLPANRISCLPDRLIELWGKSFFHLEQETHDRELKSSNWIPAQIPWTPWAVCVVALMGSGKDGALTDTSQCKFQHLFLLSAPLNPPTNKPSISSPCNRNLQIKLCFGTFQMLLLMTRPPLKAYSGPKLHGCYPDNKTIMGNKLDSFPEKEKQHFIYPQPASSCAVQLPQLPSWASLSLSVPMLPSLWNDLVHCI